MGGTLAWFCVPLVHQTPVPPPVVYVLCWGPDKEQGIDKWFCHVSSLELTIIAVFEREAVHMRGPDVQDIIHKSNRPE